MSKGKVILITLIAWLIGSSLYAYWWVTSILADPSTVGYERGAVLPLFGFLIYRGIYLLFGIIVVIWVELMLFETVLRKSRESECAG